MPTPELLQTWILPALLGLGLAAATGLRTFLPLLLVSAAARFDVFGLDLHEKVAWLEGTPALIALAAATVIELVADKVPILDHGLSLLGTVTRPAAGILAAGSVFVGVDPAVAAIAGLIIGLPTALAFHTAQTGTRLASTATTGGLANPIVSVVEDALAVAMVIIALAAPILVPLALVLLLMAIWRMVRAARARRAAG